MQKEVILAVCVGLFCYGLAAFIWGPVIIRAFRRKLREWRQVLREGKAGR
jgi:hypothetical protein